MIRSLFKHSSIYFAGLSFSKFLTVILFILLARYMGPAEFGGYIFFITVAQLITVFFDVGMIQWFQKEAHSRPANELVHTILPIRTSALAVSVAVTMIVTYFFPTQSDVLLFIILIPDAYLSVLDGYYFHIRKSYMVALKTAVKTVVMIAGVLAFNKGLNFQTVAYLYLITSVINVLWYMPWGMLKGLRLPGITAQLRVIRSSIKYAYLIFTSFAYARGDSFVVKGVLGDAALGMYGAAYRYLESLSLLPTAISHNLFPVSSKEGAVSKKQLKYIVFITTSIGVLAGAALCIGADALILLLVGPAYAPAIPVLRILSLVLILFFVSAPLSTVVQSSNLVGKFLPWGVANTIANIGLNLLLVPMLGIQGAAYSMLITEITGLIINAWFIRKIYA